MKRSVLTILVIAVAALVAARFLLGAGGGLSSPVWWASTITLVATLAVVLASGWGTFRDGDRSAYRDRRARNTAGPPFSEGLTVQTFKGISLHGETIT